MSNTTATNSTTIIRPTGSVTKRRKKHNHHQKPDNDHQSLLPGLPDHIAQLCLSLVHPSILYSVCRSWRNLMYSSSFPPFSSIYALLLPTSDQWQLSNSVKFASFDPISSRWISLPSPPPDPPLRLLLRHPSFISRNLPVQSVCVSNKLVLLAATADQFVPALSRPLLFNPLTRTWTYGPGLATPRRWCVAGVSRGVVYVASGIGSHYNPDVARSIEKWDLTYNNNDNNNNNNCASKRNGSLEKIWKWEKMGGLRDGKFSREAIDAVGWRGKLCMVNVKGDAAKEGVIYDVASDTWEDMPEGMLQGWRGPAAAMDEETIFMVDESRGVLKKYDCGKDIWVELFENEMFKGAQCIAAGRGKVCVVSGGGGVSIIVVDVVVAPPRFWVVDTPSGYQASAIHILPRMNQSDLDLSTQTSTKMA